MRKRAVMLGRWREPMKQVRVRQASDEDLDGLAQSSAALFVEAGLAHDQLRNPGWPGTDGATWCAALVADPAALVLVATADDEVVGHLVGTLVEASAMWLAQWAELVSTFVSPSRRNQGVGGRLVEDFAAWARERGAARLLVTADITNDEAVRFSQRRGFSPLSTELLADIQGHEDRDVPLG